jgi:uncharacterized protein (TIGR03067 family)
MKKLPILKSCVLAGALLACVIGCHRHQTEQPKPDGHWTGFDVTQPNAKCTLTITGTNLDFRGTGPDDWCRATFVLNEAVKPGQMDLTLNEAAPQSAGKVVLAIYELKGDEIKIAASYPGAPQRPTEFVPNREFVRVLSFKRD